MSQWAQDCLLLYGRELVGNNLHRCINFGYKPIDDTCPEWPCGCKVEFRYLDKCYKNFIKKYPDRARMIESTDKLWTYFLEARENYIMAKYKEGKSPYYISQVINADRPHVERIIRSNIGDY